MQDECNKIYPAMLVDTMKGQAAYNWSDNEDEDGPFLGRIIGAESEDKNGK